MGKAALIIIVKPLRKPFFKCRQRSSHHLRVTSQLALAVRVDQPQQSKFLKGTVTGEADREGRKEGRSQNSPIFAPKINDSNFLVYVCLQVAFSKHVLYISGTLLATKCLTERISTILENRIKDPCPLFLILELESCSPEPRSKSILLSCSLVMGRQKTKNQLLSDCFIPDLWSRALVGARRERSLTKVTQGSFFFFFSRDWLGLAFEI